MLRSFWARGGIQDHVVRGNAVVNKINNTHMKVFDAKRYGDSIDVLSSLSCLCNYVRARRASE